MVEPVSGAGQPASGPVAVLFAGAAATAVAELADTYAPALQEMADLVETEAARRPLRHIVDMLADPATARCLNVLSAAVHLTILPRSLPGYPLYRKVFAAFAQRVESLAFLDYHASVDSGQVSAALGILAARTPAAYAAAVEALSADPTVAVMAR
ncbi:hypothetical protein [Amycolatopsis jiangsuensis]|uniref:Uncharacterized protein n=1 Tax=Amycolatopsis jiangsuensis TaxID=1181879 RepID=A0A840IWS4_9PSEU|nr:hypothetical protein [Amycolatopsis jiangsuensis]MBB4687221.1 hypothetical protein [Amycolatopsis jiangsuensis]